MKAGFIPDELLNICSDVVMKFHRQNGFSNLAAKIAASDNITAIASVPDASAVLKTTERCLKIRKIFFLASVGIVCLSWLIPWWTLLAIGVVFLADRILAVRERKGWQFLSATLLSLEMLANDFSGWGKAYPLERAEALQVLNCNPASPGSAWLNYYLPQRDGFAPSAMRAYGPSVPENPAAAD